MSVALEHRHSFMAGDGRDLQVAQISVLEEPACRLMPQIMKTQVGNMCVLARFGKRMTDRSPGLHCEHLVCIGLWD